MKRVLITGADSYIGVSFENWAKAHYASEFSVDTVDMRGDAWRGADFSAYDAVFHVAGIAHADVGHVTEESRRLYYRVNRDLCLETAQKARSEGVGQFVFMSSMIIYGESAGFGKQRVITQDTEPAPVGVYGDSKWQADKGVRAMQTDAFRVAVLRPPMIYGKGSRGNYPLLAKLAKKLPFFPDVKNERSMLYIENLTECVCQLILSGKAGIFYPQNESYTNTTDMVRLIAKYAGHKIRITRLLNPAVWLAARVPGKISGMTNKAFGSIIYRQEMSDCGFRYRVADLEQSVERTEKRDGNS